MDQLVWDGCIKITANILGENMPVIIDKKGTTYKPFAYEYEKDFEIDVFNLADQIFGESSIYIDIKKKIKGKDINSIPDGYIIDMAEPESPNLFIVENEIVSHDPFRHIGIQMLRFVTSFEDSQKQIRDFLMEEITKNKHHHTRLKEGCKNSKSRNIDDYLNQAVFGEFKGIVIIDEAKSELYQVLEKINANISVIELKTFFSDDGSEIHQFDTLYDEYVEAYGSGKEGRSKKTKKLDPNRREKRLARRAESDTIIVPAREEGFKRVFLGKNQWWAIVIGPAMKEKLKYIAAYQVAPISAVTHIAKIQDIRPYKDTGKYIVNFDGKGKKLKRPIKLKDGKYAPQGPTYIKREKLLKAKSLEQAMTS